MDRLLLEEHPTHDISEAIKERTALLRSYDVLRRTLSSNTNQAGGTIVHECVTPKRGVRQEFFITDTPKIASFSLRRLFVGSIRQLGRLGSRPVFLETRWRGSLMPVYRLSAERLS